MAYELLGHKVPCYFDQIMKTMVSFMILNIINSGEYLHTTSLWKGFKTSYLMTKDVINSGEDFV